MYLVYALVGGLVSAVGALVANVLLSLGIGFVTYQGLGLFVSTMKSQFLSSVNANGALFINFMGVFQIGTAINMIASAYVARLVIAGISGGSLTKMVTKRS
jgi:Protein of unknown function (DUF2523)